MILFLKHTIKSIAKKPLQPIILIFTLMLSILTATLSLTVQDMLLDNSAILHEESYGKSDIAVTLNGSSTSRFMFTNDVNKLLGSRAEAAGVYELPLSLKGTNETVFGVAADFDEIGKIFSLGFSEFGTITSSTRTDCALISKNFAEENGLEINDTISVIAFGEEKEYRIAGISDNRFIASYDVMVDIVGVVRLMAKDSLLISALGDSFKPASTVYINILDGSTVSECVDILKGDSSFADKTFSIVSDIAKTNANTESIKTPVRIAVLLCALLSAVTTFSCLYILSCERIEENEIFAAAGAKPILLHLMQYAEIFVYWLLGGIFAFFLSLPSMHLLADFIKFSYAKTKISLSNILISELGILITAIVTVTAFIVAQKMKNLPRLKASAEKRTAIIAVAIYAVIFTTLMIIPAPRKLAVYMISIISLLIVAFIGTPILVKVTLGALNSSIDRKFEKTFVVKHRALKYALKNTVSVKMLQNTTRLITIFAMIMLTFSAIVVSQNQILFNLKNIFSAEYAIFNATERCHDKLEECQTVENTYNVYMGSATQADGTPIYALSSPDISVFSDEMDVTRQPSGSEAIISKGQAIMLGIDVGDKIEISINDTVLSLTVIETTSTCFAILVFDAEHYGIPYNMLMARGVEGAEPSKVIAEISDKTAAELATVSLTRDLMEARVDIVEMYLRAGQVLLAIIVLFVCIGLINNLYDSYRARAAEFALFELSGMSRKEICRMKIYEVSTVMILGMIFGGFGTILSIFATNAGLETFGHQTISNILKALGLIT